MQFINHSLKTIVAWQVKLLASLVIVGFKIVLMVFSIYKWSQLLGTISINELSECERGSVTFVVNLFNNWTVVVNLKLFGGLVQNSYWTNSSEILREYYWWPFLLSNWFALIFSEVELVQKIRDDGGYAEHWQGNSQSENQQ